MADQIQITDMNDQNNKFMRIQQMNTQMMIAHKTERTALG